METQPRSARRPARGVTQRLKADGRRTLEQRKRSAAERVAAALPPALPTALAAEFYGEFNVATSWLAIANGYMRRGNSEGAVATLTSAVRASPRTSELWIGLGNAMVTVLPCSAGYFAAVSAMEFSTPETRSAASCGRAAPALLQRQIRT